MTHFQKDKMFHLGGGLLTFCGFFVQPYLLKSILRGLAKCTDCVIK